MSSVSEAQILDLFRQNTIVEIKDYNIELSQKTVKVKDEFKEALYQNYQQILNVTNDIDSLLTNLKTTNTEFTKLCFDDNSFKLNKLPDFISPQPNATDIDLSDNHIEEDLNSTTSNILIVSQWSIAVSDFICRFNASSTSSEELLDNLIRLFFKLSDNIDVILKKFKVSVERNSKQFIDFLFDVSSYGNHTFFSLKQWIMIYKLVNDEKISKLAWDKSILTKLNNAFFQNIFKFSENELFYHNYTKMNNNNFNKDSSLIKDFIETDIFKTKYIENLESQIDNKFKIINSIRNEIEKENGDIRNNELNIPKVTLRFYPETTHNSISISELVANSYNQSLGLTTSKRNDLYVNIKPLLTLLSQLKKHSENDFNKANCKKQSDKLIKILEEIIPKVSETELEINKDETVNMFVDDFVNLSSDLKFRDLLNKLIKEIKEI
ncbi:hypothetical protein TPHA_0E02610 [Tetrapisispora phaffii CBS 4417]|uniref:Uncharacterized protein n=1 Tax=Tetrapisispora phaffii (strain ATCC 24235 / CBS 4417 / NBRC 1672 / NRRL Y-8282 / UCD 70-5) TaxID=1071381 RepID=G8BTX5_TETPH|nr:hypothetical protein TPHA_0E02610 [Tetrapisispora phaffii CBS 4417]CCE63353.1 hypothetical protein TPHA_0E02610 [Tetrapisispora phaffii CBS 4417]